MTNPLSRLIRLGDSAFTPRQFQYFQSGLREGIPRNTLRSLFQQSFGIGFSNSAFTAGRELLQQSIRAGDALAQLTPGQRLSDDLLPRINRNYQTAQYSISAKAQIRNRETGALLEWPVRFNTDEPLTPQNIQTRIAEILDAGIERAESDLEIEFIGEYAVYFNEIQ